MPELPLHVYLDSDNPYQPDDPASMQSLVAILTQQRVVTSTKLINIKDQPDSLQGAMDLFLHRCRMLMADGLWRP